MQDRRRAEQSDIWHVSKQADLQARGERALYYDGAAIKRYVDELIEHNEGWLDWFDENGLKPLRLAYEDLESNQNAQLNTVLEFIGVEHPRMSVETDLLRMADAISLEWIERYRAESPGFREARAVSSSDDQ